ncbi:MAG: tRNA (adenosine(37)-N6)-threonylcarbamoyltransferase complex dimerization subunit type 1 TsaB [Parasphingorhabdus sp.]
MGQRLLVIDTATAACSVALFEDNELIANDYLEIGRGHAEKLVPMIAALPNLGQADEILVNCGPGSFTGLRIGISVAKALSLAWGADLKGYQCLQLMAAQGLSITLKPIPVFVCMLAGHGEYFVQNFSETGHAMDELESLGPEAARRKNQSGLAIGSGKTKLFELAEADDRSQYTFPDAASAILLKDNQMTSDVVPIYVREPDALKSQSL